MREIKFKAWIKNRQEMFYGGYSLSIDDCRASVIGLPDEVVLLQYTGLKDKNGKEIYEGDIVTADYKVMTSRYKVVIEEGHTQLAHPTLAVKYFLDRANRDIYEVIGNIYENPELLKEVD